MARDKAATDKGVDPDTAQYAALAGAAAGEDKHRALAALIKQRSREEGEDEGGT